LVRIATKSSDSVSNKKADYLALLTNPTRRSIRDILSRHGELTLTEIAHRLGLSEQNVYHHLNKMVEAGLVIKRKDKVKGRLVTFYRLSNEYYNIINKPVKVDLNPLYALFIMYGVLIIVAILAPNLVVSLFSVFGLNSVEEVVGSILTGFFTTTVILIYYIMKYLYARNIRSD